MSRSHTGPQHHAGMVHRYRLTVRGPVPRGVAELIGDRFTGASVRRAGPATRVELTGADQPALRALLTLLWDAGHDILSFTSDQDSP